MTGNATSRRQGWFRRLFPADPVIGPNTFVLWEPCSRSHGEIVPGYARYLLDLGYDVLVLMTPARLTEGLFSRFDDPRLTHGGLSQRRIRRFMRKPDLKRAKGVMVTTAGKLPRRQDQSWDLPRVFGAKPPQPLMLVEHDARAQIDAGLWSPDTITLRPLDYRGAASVVVNPHDFGDVRVTPKTTGKTVFVMVGAARAKRGNQPLVFEAARTLLETGDTSFEIRIIGKPGKAAIPAELTDHVHVLGRLSFAQMYSEIEDSDILLTSFQGNNPDHAFYRSTGTSGVFQLAYGFCKPIVLQSSFATSVGFDASNSLIYDADADLVAAMRAAIRLTPAAYADMQASLTALRQSIHRESLANLKALIHG